MEFLPERFKTGKITGTKLRGNTVLSCLPSGLCLLVFLRHGGCIFSREAVSDLREISESCLSFPPVLFFFPGSETEAAALFSGIWDDACVVFDPEVSFYEDMELSTGTFSQLIGPEVFFGTARAVLKGHFYGIPGSNSLRMPGVFLTVRDRIVWEHRYRHIGDHPDWKNIPGVTLLTNGEFVPGVQPA
ncbi:AhpC/TSA family protein [Leptospira gomenensis]|uniref:AhpC/TSA family protein n=1 Tax=Leptospira gomenensis TaxID=2484974 RepID=A0A5F1YKV0_9LEPT|nr:SelL-related redox protein [Leptospira gomenensis]TGK34872.1 AhpC/TSA family protein [Leptospira gomenensis]TGK41120.1 AhpC/TSA family protein [Leptospira gomenensis]TGK42077.1 AhpC/TSA family protein [Leptospira gomenensis]TGK56339.1 AhpC/TSA family protein [Leptospira gomenensis]